MENFQEVLLRILKQYMTENELKRLQTKRMSYKEFQDILQERKKEDEKR